MFAGTIIALSVLILLIVCVSYITNSITEACLILITFCMLINTGYLIYSHIKTESMMQKYNYNNPIK